MTMAPERPAPPQLSPRAAFGEPCRGPRRAARRRRRHRRDVVAGSQPPARGRCRGHGGRAAGRVARGLPGAGAAAADGTSRLVRARRRLRPADCLAPRVGHEHRAAAGGARAPDRRGLQPHRPPGRRLDRMARPVDVPLDAEGDRRAPAVRAGGRHECPGCTTPAELRGVVRRAPDCLRSPSRSPSATRSTRGRTSSGTRSTGRCGGPCTCSWRSSSCAGGSCCRSAPGCVTGCWWNVSWSRVPVSSASGCAVAG